MSKDDETKDLPTTHTESTDLLDGAGGDDYVEPIPKQHGQLWLDNGKQKKSVKIGTWNFMGQPHEALHFTFLKGHLYRKLFEGKYEAGRNNRVVCVSWDGVHAFGQQKLGWDPESMKAHVCGQIDDGGMLIETCPLAQWHRDQGNKNVCLCPEKKRWLLLCYVPSREVWLPAFFEAEGGHVRRWQAIYDKTSALATKAVPVQRLGVQLRTHKDDAGFWNPSFGNPTSIPDPDWKLVLTWVKAHAVELFRKSVENVKRRAFELKEGSAEPGKGDGENA